MSDPFLSHVDALTGSGKAVVSADDATVVALVKKAIESDQSASFYLTRSQASAVREWYWTPERTRFTGIKPISAEEDNKISSDLGLNVTNFRFAPSRCECGHEYGAFDFLAQGIRQHGLEAVRAIFSLENSTFFQVNPTFVAVCPACDRELPLMRDGSGGGWFDCGVRAGAAAARHCSSGYH